MDTNLGTIGNIHNEALLALCSRREGIPFGLLVQHSFVELSQSQLITHK